MIMLDEAFAGIDGTMRRQLLGLICQFDLDFMMTSHELWCCEPELDRLSIYHLHRQAGLPGVGAVQFLWDGHTKREVAEAA
jgi:ABC-type Mn2+/Zn2+ transport system ATPase subunit